MNLHPWSLPNHSTSIFLWIIIQSQDVSKPLVLWYDRLNYEVHNLVEKRKPIFFSMSLMLLLPKRNHSCNIEKMQGFSHIKVHILDSLISSFWSICSRWSKKLSCQGASWKQQIKNKTREEDEKKEILFIYLPWDIYYWKTLGTSFWHFGDLGFIRSGRGRCFCGLYCPTKLH